jgi:RNA-directed DNA polymerase
VSAPSPHLYRQQALAQGRDPATVDRALEVESRIRARHAHPIFTLNHLAQLTGATWAYLRDIVARRQDPYLSIDRLKRNGTTRAISSPHPVLMDVQRWILHNVLSACDVHPSSYAYQRERSILHCAEAHLHSRWLVKMDIHDFFGSILERRVYPIFLDLGYPPLLSLELARLCTRSRALTWEPEAIEKYGDSPYPVSPRARLPQGAPTSGALANAVMVNTDAKLHDLALSKGLVYTRYSDDLIFSTGADFTRQRAAELIRRAAGILHCSGFSPHRTKTRVIPPGARHVVLGLLLTDGRVRLLPEFKRRVEVHIRGIVKFGIAEHAHHRHFDSVLAMINHVDGCIAFADSIDPEFATNAREAWSAALRDRGYIFED